MPRKKGSLSSESLTDEALLGVLHKINSRMTTLLTRWNSCAAASPAWRREARQTLRRDHAKRRQESTVPTALL
jgi:hypothetical protein